MPSEETQFTKGVSGNPGGKSAEREELRRYVREQYSRDSIDGIAQMAGLRFDENGQRLPAALSDKVRLDAYKWLAEQGTGKAVQAVSGPDGQPISLFDFSGLTSEQLLQLEAIRSAIKVKP